MTTSLLFAATHHVLAFALVAILALQAALVRRDFRRADILRIGRLDIAYGGVFTLLLTVGLSRAFFFEKGWDHYSGSYAFWIKIGLYLLAAIASVYPTIAFIQWRQASKSDPAFTPQQAQIDLIRRMIFVQAIFLLAIPVLAALMARGF